MEAPAKLTWSQRLCFAVGHTMNEMCASMWFSYLIIYLQLVLGFGSNYAGFVLLIGQVADALATPLLGIETSSKHQYALCRRYGKRKTLHLIGTIMVLLSFPFIFSVCPGCENASEFALTVMLVPLVIIFQIGWAAVQVSHLSLIPFITPHEAERDFLNVFRYAMNVVSDIGTYVIVWCVFDLTSKPTGSHQTITGDYANKFLMIICIVLGVGAVFSVIFQIGVKEPPSPSLDYDEKSQGDPNVIDSSSSVKNVTLSWIGWLKEIHFYQVALLYMCCRLFQNMTLVFMPLYLQESLRADPDLIAKIPLAMNVAGFVMSMTLPKLFKKLSKKITFLVGVGFGLGASTWILVGHGDGFSNTQIYCVGVLSGFASSILVICSLSFTHDLIGTSPESGAFVYGCMSFSDKLANGIAGMIIQYMHALTCKRCDWFYRDVLSYGVGGTALLACAVLATLHGVVLGERKSTYNGARPKLPQKKEIVNATSMDTETIYSTIEESTPLLKDV